MGLQQVQKLIFERSQQCPRRRCWI